MLSVLSMSRCARTAVLFVAAVGVVGSAVGQSGTTAGEARTVRAFDAAKKAGAPELYAFLKPMPKGADLHMHLSGAIYAETFIAEAIAQNMCVDTVKMGFVPNVGLTKMLPPQPVCPEGAVAASSALKDQKLYDNLIDWFSMRSFVPSAGWSGHDQFFVTFGRFGGLKNVAGEWLDEVATRAATQNEQYLETMQTPPFGNAAKLGYKIGWPAGAEKSVTPAQLKDLRDALLAGGLRDEVAVDSKDFADAKAAQRAMEHCDTAPTAACKIEIKWLYQVLRGYPPQQVFAQTLLGFEVASADPEVVGINFVMPEDGRVSMQDYHLQMQMLDYLHSVYPKVHISLHAGEVAPGLVPPDGLTFHIREAVELGHAERIGHGVDVLYEDRPAELLKEMADKHVMVEVNLTSNDVILGIEGKQHPLAAYRAAHVPVALSTDDEGVSRIELTHEYVRGAMEQGLGYADLKTMVRTSLEHSFLPGESLWASPDNFAKRSAACAGASFTKPATGGCAEMLKSSLKAAQEFELERRFVAFEAAQK